MLVDGAVLGLVTYGVARAVSAPSVASSGTSTGVRWTIFIIDFVVGGAYFTFANGLGRGQTIGNRLLGIAVRDAATGEAIGVGRGLARWVSRDLLYMCLAVPGLVSDLFPLWDGQHQTLADKAARSVMVRVR